MSVYASPAASTEATVDGLAAGLVGTLTFRIEDGQNGVILAATTAGIVQSGIGIYTVTFTSPAGVGQYVMIWNDGTNEVAEDLTVTYSTSFVGGSYFTVAELRARYPELTVLKYSDVLVTATARLAEQAFEDAADMAFITRTETAAARTDVSSRLPLPRNRVTAITSADGATTGSIDVTSVRIVGGTYAVGVAWPVNEDITVEIEHGYTEPPLRVVRAVELLTRTWLINGPIDARATQAPAADGGVINLSTPGLLGAEFGIPEVDATLRTYKHVDLVL